MTPTTRRRGAAPDAAAVADLTSPPEPAGALAKAPEQDPVLAAAARPPRARRSVPATGSKEQLKVWISAEDAGRARSAFLHTRTETGYRSLSDLVGRAVMREVKRLEKAHHGGTPWEPAQAGDLPTGRPVGS